MAQSAPTDSALDRITDLVREERQLYRRGDMSDTDRARLEELEVELDQCWDLLRQRDAKQEFGMNPDTAKVRPKSVASNKAAGPRYRPSALNFSCARATSTSGCRRLPGGPITSRTRGRCSGAARNAGDTVARPAGQSLSGSPLISPTGAVACGRRHVPSTIAAIASNRDVGARAPRRRSPHGEVQLGRRR
jgi:hypothetical protein